MKKILFVALMILSAQLYSQSVFVDSVVFNIATINADTSIKWFPIEQPSEAISIDFKYNTTNCNDAYITVVGKNQQSLVLEISSSSLPILLNKTTFDSLNTGKGIFLDSFYVIRQGVALMKGSCTSGTVIAKRTLFAPMKRNTVFP